MLHLDLPRIELGLLPTPIQELPRLSDALGRRILIKRDDQTGLALGGNKVRKLELLLGAARDHGANLLITCGAPQSNHCRQTAAAAARAGLRCVLVLQGGPPQGRNGNLLLDELLGASLVWSGERPPDEVMAEVAAREQASGARPYLIPYGGSSAVGVVGYVLAAAELAAQLELAASEAAPVIFLASSSGGTQAGLLLGQRLAGLRAEVRGISVLSPAAELRARVAALANEAARLLRVDGSSSEEDVLVDDRFLGAGYGIPGELEREAIRLFARTEGILLDPVYTARAAGGLIALLRRGEIAKGRDLLFWHTGGTPAVFAYADQL